MPVRQQEYRTTLTKEYLLSQVTMHFATSLGPNRPALDSQKVQEVSVVSTENKNPDDGTLRSQGYMITFKRSQKRAWLAGRYFMQAGVMKDCADKPGEMELAVDMLGWDAENQRLITPKDMNPVANTVIPEGQLQPA